MARGGGCTSEDTGWSPEGPERVLGQLMKSSPNGHQKSPLRSNLQKSSPVKLRVLFSPMIFFLGGEGNFMAKI